MYAFRFLAQWKTNENGLVEKEHGVVVKAFDLYCIRISLKSQMLGREQVFHPLRQKIKQLAEKNKRKKRNGEQTDLCDLEQVRSLRWPLLDLLAANMIPKIAM